MKHLYIILFILPLIGFGQGWEQIFGSAISDEIGYSVKQTSDGGYVIGGHNEEGSQGWNVWIIKTPITKPIIVKLIEILPPPNFFTP